MPECNDVMISAMYGNYRHRGPISIQEVYGFDTLPRSAPLLFAPSLMSAELLAPQGLYRIGRQGMEG